MSALLDSHSTRCKHRPPPDDAWYGFLLNLGPINKYPRPYGYPMLIVASHWSNTLQLPCCFRYAAILDDYIPAANTSAAPVTEAMLVTQDFATPVPTPDIPSSATAPSLIPLYFS